MNSRRLFSYISILTILCTVLILTILSAGESGRMYAQLYMLTPALAAVITRLIYFRWGFAGAFLSLGSWREWIRFWGVSVMLALVTYVVFTITGAVRWDLSGELFLDNLTEQFAKAGQNINETLPPGITPRMMLMLYTIGSFTIFNVLPGLITGFGEEFGHRGCMFHLMAKKNLTVALILGGVIWFLWHTPLILVMPPITPEPTITTLIVNAIALCVGSVAAHTWFAYVLYKTKSIWITALAHITFNNVSTAMGFFVKIEDQTVANIGLSATMVVFVTYGLLNGDFKKVLTAGAGANGTLIKIYS